MNRKWILLGVVAACAAAVALFLLTRGGDDAAKAKSTAAARDAGAARAPDRDDPASRGGVDGVVVDAAGKPVDGAIVRAVPDRGGLEPDDDEAPVARAGADGAFALDVAPGEVLLTASAAGHAPAEVRTTVRAGERTRVELKLGAGGVTVKGVVSDVTGGTVDGALIVLSPEAGILRADGRRALAANSGADGAYALGVTPGRYRVSTTHPEYVPDVRSLEVGPGGATLDLALVPGGIVEGTVRDRASGQPVPNATVSYSREVVREGPMGGANAEERGRGSVEAGADGTFRITGLGAGRILLNATAQDDRASDEPAEVLLGIAETATDVDVFVAPALSITGRVVDPAGAPVEGAMVMVSMRGNGNGVFSDADGRFHAGGLLPGRYHLMAESDAALPSDPTEVELVDQPATGVTLTLKGGAFVSGRVEPAGLADVFVRPPDEQDFKLDPNPGMIRMQLGGGPRVRTSPDGTFRIGPFEPGPVRLGARAADGRRGELDVEMTKTGVDGAVITLEARGSIAGRVVGQSGAPVPDAVVSLKRRPAPGQGERMMIVNGVDIGADRAPADSQGNFAIAGLDAGTWELTVLDGRGSPMAFARKKDEDAPERVELKENEQKTGVTLTVQVNDAVIEGVVVGPDGKAVPDAWVTLRHGAPILGAPAQGARRAPTNDSGPREDGDEGPRSMMVAEVIMSDGGDVRAGEVPPVLTDDEGRFTVRGLRHGKYRVSAEGLRGVARGAVPDVETGTKVTVKLHTLSVLRGVVTRGGAPVVDYRVTVEGPTRKGRAVHADDGRFSLQGLDPGEYRVVVKSRDGSGEATATIEAGKETTVEIQLQGDGTVIGQMLDAARAPIAGAMVVITAPQPPGETMISLDEPPPMTGSDGRFRAPAEPGKRTLLILGNNGPVVRRDIDVVDGQVLDLGTLTPDPEPPGP